MYFLLLILEILFDFNLDDSYKQDKFSKILLKKSFLFVSSKKNSIVTFNLGFIVLLIEVNSVSK